MTCSTCWYGLFGKPADSDHLDAQAPTLPQAQSGGGTKALPGKPAQLQHAFAEPIGMQVSKYPAGGKDRSTAFACRLREKT